MSLSIEAAISNSISKIPPLRKIKIEMEVLKRLVLLENELNIINNIKYLEIENRLIEISKMASGWIKYLETQKELVKKLLFETSERARKLSEQLSALFQLILNLSSFMLQFGTLPSELREPLFNQFSLKSPATFFKIACVVPLLEALFGVIAKISRILSKIN